MNGFLSDLNDWAAERGGFDRVTAEISAFLSTPYPAVRSTRVSLVVRMHKEAGRIVQLRKSWQTPLPHR